MLPYKEFSVNDFHLLVVETAKNVFRLYASRHGRFYCHYDSGRFDRLRQAGDAAERGFNPDAFLLFPYTPYSRDEVLRSAPHSFDILQR